MGLFGSSKKKEKTQSPEEALKTIEGLRKTLDDLDKRQKLLEVKAKNELETAKEKNRLKDKRSALYALKKKKMYEAESAKLDGAKMNLEQQIFMIEGAHSNVSVFQAMKAAQATVKAQHKNISIEQVDELRDDMEEQQAMQEELNEALMQPLGGVANMDEDELMDELNALEATDLEEQMLDIGVPNAMKQPAQPVVANVSAPAPPVPARRNEQQEMDDLMNEMQMT